MKRIIAALTGKVEKLKMERKLNRVKRSIDAARDNAQDEIDRLEERKASLVERMSSDTEANCIINQLSDLIGQQEDQQAIIERLDKVESYLEEDVEVEDKE